MDKKVSLFVPGRLCLFGEHSDWAGAYMMQNSEIVEGRAIVSGINLGIYATAEASARFRISTLRDGETIDSFSSDMEVKELRKHASEAGFYSYCCGVAAYLKENYHVGGISIEITKVTLPMKKGLSSSAAICCLVAKAFNEIYNLHISTRGIMQIAYRGELLTGSRCGRLDQACAYGERPIVMHFSYSDIDVETLRVGKTLYWVVADLCAGKDTKKILAYLNKAYPFATNEIERREQEALGRDNHVIISRAREAIENGDAQKLGEIMCEAQKLFDEKVAPACPDELSSPVLHSVLNDPKLQQWIWGGKGVGSQGDGTVQFLARDEDSQQQLIRYLKDEVHIDPFPFTLNAGGKVRKAIIPVAGNGTRMFPETLFINKAFLPIVDENGVTKPALLYMLEELVDAEIEEIYLVIGENDEEEYKRVFQFDYSEEYEKLLPENLRNYYKKIHEIGQRIHLVIQREKKGLGHAVYQARKFIKDEPVLVMLGDFIYKSNLAISCTQQTINAYNKSGGKSVVSIKNIPFEESAHYGVIHGQFGAEHSYIMDVDCMVEKPDTETAKRILSVNNACYATFGQYVLTDEVFDFLEKQIGEMENNAANGGVWQEIDLTSALTHQASKRSLVGVYVDGTSYDVGIPDMYYKTFTAFGKPCFE